MAERQSSNLHQQIIGNCIGCQGLIRLSTQTKVNSKIRCPHCKEVFPVVAILDQAAPMAEVIDDARDESVVAHVDRVLQSPDKQRVSADSFVVPPQLAKGARRRRRSSSSSSRSGSRGESRESSREVRSEAWRQTAPKPDTSAQVDVMDRGGAEIQVESGDQDQDRNRAEQQRQSRRSAGDKPRRSRQSQGAVKTQQDFERNAGYEFVKVAFGAGLALPIAYLLVLWVFGQDPLGVGKSIGGTAPFLVPAEYRAGAADAKDEKANEKANKRVIDIDPRLPGNDLIPYLAPKTLDGIGG